MNAPKRSKPSRSPELTGGEGFTYEDTIVAYYLTALLHESGAAGVSGQVVRVAVQQASHGEPLDDIVVDAQVTGEARRLSLQIKRQLTISAADSNADFREIIANARETRAKPAFRVGLDRYGFIARAVGEQRFRSLERIVSRAQASTRGAEFAARFRKEGESSQSDIDLRNELMTLLRPADDEEEADFYRHFVPLRMDGFDPSGDRYVDMVNRLGQLTTAGSHEGALLVEALCRHVRDGEGSGRVWTRPALLAHLRALARLKVAPSYADDITILRELAGNSVSDIRQDIGGIAIARHALVDKAEQASHSYKFSNISGLPGCGKSVVLRHLVERALGVGSVLFLKSDRLTGATWQAFATSLGLQHHSPEQILAEIGAIGIPTLFVDGIDRVRPEHRPIVTDLLHTMERDSSLAHWRVVVTSRDQGLEPLRQWVPASFYRSTGIGDVPVGPLNDDEAEQLAEQQPQLRQLLFGASAVREIARRPFFAAILANQSVGSETDRVAPQTESELVAGWWRAGGYNATPDAVLQRQRALIDLAEAGAGSLGKAIPARGLQASTIAQIAELKGDHIVEIVEDGSVFSFAHDIFFEWAYFRLLIDRGSAWQEVLSAAGEPPLLARVAGLLSQHTFESKDSWREHFESLAGAELRPQWRRVWLLAPPASTRFDEFISTFEGLLFANSAFWLSKFLVWFQAECTIPNPILLGAPSMGLDGATLVRAADTWGWPSDPAVWQRVLSWILDRHAEFPATAIPLAVELFAVFQNMLGDVANPMSARLVEITEVWLIELEKPRTFVKGKPTESTRWDALPDGVRKDLHSALRELILRSGRGYPDAARRLVERAIALERRSGGLFESIVGFSPILAEVCPEKLAELVRVEVLEPLPREKMQETRRNREAHYRHLRHLRTKPESELSVAERRFLSVPPMIHGEDRYDFSDLGVDEHHSAFYPPTPLHQPFASLFHSAPDVARGLVRDIANRATQGWRQIHEINAPRYGTPLPMDVALPWGIQRFWGDMRTYSWFLGVNGPQPLEAALLALAYWAHKSIDAGRSVDDIIRDVVEGHESWTVLGLATSLALEKPCVSESVLALVTTQRLWHADMARQVQDPVQHLTVFGMNPRDRMTLQQQEAFDYLKGRRFRRASIRDITPLFAVSSNSSLRERLRVALQRFPQDLPFTYEEEKSDAARKEGLAETAKIWATWGDPSNYQVEQVADQEGVSLVMFQSPEAQTEGLEQQRQESAKAIGDFNIIHWARKSFDRSTPDPQYDLSAVIAFARSRDSETLMQVVAEAGEGATQTCVAAAAAAAACFSSKANEVDWGWSVLARVVKMAEGAGPFRHTENPYDPRLYAILAHFYSLRKDAARPESVECLLGFAGDANLHLAQAALASLLRQEAAPRVRWIAAVMASELFLVYTPAFDEKGQRDESAQARHREEARRRALSHPGKSGEVLPSFAAPPSAWVKAPRRGRRGRVSEPAPDEWQHPRLDFNVGLAASLTRVFPVEEWLATSDRRGAFLTYLEQLVGWTIERLFPSWMEEGERRRRSTDMFEWLSALADLVTRVSEILPPKDVIDRLVEPFGRHDHEDAIAFVADLTSSVMCRRVYDASVVTDDALELLGYCLTRMLDEREFDPSSYRAGELHGFSLPNMVRSLLLVSVEDAPGAARFANGQWSDLPRLMPLIDELMLRTGWSSFVMSTYLTLCERGAGAFPIDAFAQHIVSSLDALVRQSQNWSDTTIPARIAGVVQGLAEANHPLTRPQARDLLHILDRLVDMGDRRAAALQQSEYFRRVQLLS